MTTDNIIQITNIPYKIVFVSNDISREFVPDNVEYSEKEDVDSHKSYVLNEINYNELCKGINKEYIDDSLDNSLFFLYIIKTSRPRNIEGVIIVKTREEDNVTNSLYIDILCGSSQYKGVGSILLNKVIDIGKKLGKKSIILSSLTQSIGFYIKKGFKFVDTCNMKLNLTGGKSKRYSIRKQYKKSTKRTQRKKSKK